MKNAIDSDTYKRCIFVFGSNQAGRHGAGAALFAFQNCGAVYGEGVGLHGDSYAIPTKDHKVRTLPLDTIEYYVRDFLNFAIENPQMLFLLTPIGCGLAGYNRQQIGGILKRNGIPINVVLTREWITDS